MAQFKKVFTPDSTVLQEPSYFTATKVVETDIPGKQLMVAGTMIAQDTGNYFRIAAYNQLSDLHGNSQALFIYEDTSQFVFQGPKAYCAAYGGNGEFYTGIGSNNKQIVYKSNSNGDLLWSRTAHHHEFYSMQWEGNSLIAMGQDESVQGAHDFSLWRLNPDGSEAGGRMYGTTGFEQPQRVELIRGSLMLVGSSFQSGAFSLLVAKVDTGLNQVWGHTYTIGTKTTVGYSILAPLDGHGYFVTGVAKGGTDSLFVMRLDDNGQQVWAKLYSIAGASESNNWSSALDPATGGIVLVGSYRTTGYLRPWGFMVDSVGAVQWSYDYGDPGVNTDETLNDVIYCNQDGYFYTVGDRVEVDSNLFLRRTFMVKFAADSGSIPCDSIIQVTSAPTSFTMSGNTAEEPFSANAHFPIGIFISTNMMVETQCTVLVGLVDGLPKEGLFSIVNPSSGLLDMRAEVPLGGGVLRVHSLSGAVMLERRLDEGMVREQFSLSGIAAGMYMVTLEGEGWRYPSLRWVVQR
ncbi:MAG: hypothetical protein U0176_17375 [Bacteroidia bacterium]